MQSKMAAGGNQTCTETGALFSMTKGVSRVQVELLAPAWFNRFGDALKGSRVLEIIKLILIQPGFATYKYEHAWVVAPDPAGGFQMADLANRMAALDSWLPKRDRKTFYGTFRKSHLAAALLIIKQGTFKWPETDQYITADQGNADLKDTLRLGMRCQVWDHEDVTKHIESFKILMASDNWEADEQMGDDELSVMNRIFECKATVHSPDLGLTKDQSIIRSVKKICSTAWTDNELYVLLDYVKSTTPQAFDLLRIFQTLTTDPLVFNVLIRHFKEMTESFGMQYQWLKLTLTCAMYGADRTTETKKAGGRGKVEPTVITQKHLKNVLSIPADDLMKVEAFLRTSVQHYWLDLQSSSHALGPPLLKEFGAFLQKVGRKWTSVGAETTFDALRPRFASMEDSLRKYLKRAGASLGPAILQAEDAPMDTKAIQAANKAA